MATSCTEENNLKGNYLDADCLLDGFLALFEECTHDDLYKIKNVSRFIKKYNKSVSRIKTTRMKASDFELKAVIGRGHFGEVRVVREKTSGNVYAMKVMRKSDILSQLNIAFFEEERDIMSSSHSPWITRLHFAFQDSINLYLVMDFHPGGDLLSLLSRHDDIFEENMAKFYLAEMAIAIHSLHTLGYLHRDIKPENILLDHKGHVKLADFGSAAKLNNEDKVLAEMPVGTPDYVAPELLDSMNRSTRHVSYGPEVDWWSLGICAFEMLFGGMPFTNDHSSMVATYANILNFKDSLQFPEDSDVSPEAKSFILGLLTDQESRLQWEEIKKHPFFSGISWDSIRNGTAAYVPSINGSDDTSHFDEVEQARHQLDLEAIKPQREFSGRDLPFIGFTFSKDVEPIVMAREIRVNSTSSQALDMNNSNVLNTGGFLDSTMAESPVERRSTSPMLINSGFDNKAISILENISSMNREIKSLEDELLGVRWEEMKSEIILLEAEQEKLMSKLMMKERQLEKTQALLEECQKKLEMQQLKLDKERRKSRDDQRRDLMFMDMRAETWQNLLEEKQAVIETQNRKLREYEGLLEAFEESEEKQAEEVEHLQHKLNVSLQNFSVGNVQLSGDSVGEAKVELDNFHHENCPSQKKLTLHVTVKAGRCSFVDNKTLTRLQELQKMVDKYAERANGWRNKEEELNTKIISLETETKTLAQKEGLGRKMKETLMEKVALYQKEVTEQKAIIKDLQETMKQYLSQSSHQTHTEGRLKEAMHVRLDLEKQLAMTKEEVEFMRQAALNKTSEMEDAILKLEEQRSLAEDYKKRYDCQVAVMEAKLRPLEEELAKITADRQRLERRETSLTTQVETLQGLLDDRNLELDKLHGRNTDLQAHLQLLQQRNADLQVEVEKLQKTTSQKDEQKQAKAELNFQVKRLQQEKSDLEHRIIMSRREKHGLEDKISMAEREKERLMRRIDRLEHTEKEKHELETKVEKITVLERENRRLTVKVERLTVVEKDKLNLEEKLDRLQFELKKEKINLEAAVAEKKSLEDKLEALKTKKGTEKCQEIAKLKAKVSLLETIEREKTMCEKEKERLNRLCDRLQQEKSELESLKILLENEKTKVERERKAADEKVRELTKEKLASEELAVNLNRQVNRLESGLGALQSKKTSEEGEVRKLRFEIDRLTTIVDKLEQDKNGKGSEVKRKSSETRSTNLVEKLQREKAALQKQIEEMTTLSDKQSSLNRRQSILLLQGRSLRGDRENAAGQVKALEEEAASLKSQLKEAQGKASKTGDSDKIQELSKKVVKVKEENTTLTLDLEKSRKEIDDLKSKLETQMSNFGDLRDQVEEQSKTESELIAQLEKESATAKRLHEENEKMSAQLKRASLAEPSRKSGELKFEKMQLDNKIKELTDERDQMKKKLDEMSEEKATCSNSDAEEIQKQFDEYKKEMEIRLGASKFPGGDISAYLRHEINESNLALSEARSSLSASKRRELELKERIDQLQRTLDNRVVENARYLQNAKGAMAELKDLMSQHDMLRRQHKVLEEKHSELVKQRGTNSSESVRLMEEMSSKTQLFEMECKKTEKLTQVCSELEEQVKDLESAIAEADKREAEWNKIKRTYEAAVNEKEDELQGVSYQIEEICLAKSEASTKINSLKQQLESEKALHRADVEQLSHQLREEDAKSLKLAAKINDMGEKESASVMVIESQRKETDKFAQEILRLKEELAESLNDCCNYRKENLKLNKHLEDAMVKFEMITGEKVSLENFNEALQGLHFLEKYKFESTIGQQMKLIDYLQDLYLEHSGKKKKSGRFFGGSKGNSNKDLSSLPLPWTDLQTALEQERTKCTLLQEQVDKLRDEKFQQANELLKLRGSKSESQGHKVQANLTVKVTPSAMKALSQSQSNDTSNMAAASSTNSLSSIASSDSCSSTASSRSASSMYSSTRKGPRTPGTHERSKGHRRGRSWKAVDAMPTPQRMHHNIPHRFTTGLNSRATKCGLCLGSVHFVRQASKCQDCGMVVHPKCAASVPASCGLPTEYVRHFAYMMSSIGRDEITDEFFADETAIKMEGWMKIPRIGKSGWEKRYCKLEGNWLTLFLDEADANPVDSFDLNPADADVSIHSAVTSAEFSNVASSDLYYVLRLDQDPITTCWPGRYLYLMTTSFQDKQRWVASLEAVVKCAQCKSSQHHNRSEVITVLSLKDDEQKDFNCTLAISKQLVLVGTDDGLFAFNPQAMTSKRKQMTQLSGFGSVHQMLLAKGVDLVLILTGPERRLIMLENKLIKSRMSQTLGGETTPFSFRIVEGLQECTIFDVAVWNKSSYLCVGTPKKVYLMRYNPSLAMYCVRKEFPSTEPCSCVCIAENYVIIGTDRFYKINMEHPSMLDFVDRQDNSLAFAAYGASNHKSFPLAVIQVSPPELPLEFLLCFHEFGVFVDHHGQRSRQTDVKWSGFPLAFTFQDPFLYITYFNTVQATVIPTDRSIIKGRQTVIDLPSPRYLGPAPSLGSVYISTIRNSGNVTDIVQVRGQEDFVSTLSGDKENLGSSHSSGSDRHVTFGSPTKLPKTPQINRLRRQGSLTSLNSNSSSSTFVSVESDV